MALSFRQAIEDCLAQIPKGKVATCGTIARGLGDVRAARSVAMWLLDHRDTPGAHRVVHADGRLLVQAGARTLAREGVRLRNDRVADGRFVTSIPATPILETLRAEQQRLAAQVVEADVVASPETFGGVDVAYVGEHGFAVAVRLDAVTLETAEVSVREVDIDFPYVPTYLAFREFPAVRAALDGLSKRPDVLFVDGHGRLHPALFGFACFVGVRLNLPTIGIAKHPLAGRPLSSESASSATPIHLEGMVRGYAWTPPGASRPFYVSVGHNVSLHSALAFAQKATKRRYPEPLVLADRLSKERKSKKNAERSASGHPAARRAPAQEREGV